MPEMRKMRGRRLDITGRRFGMLTAICPTEKKNAVGSVLWKCRCDCGKETEASVSELNKGNKKSCGCLKESYQHKLRERLHVVDETCTEWLEGRRRRSDNSSGFRGVYKKKNGKYCVSIGFKKKIYYIGIFEDYQDAVEARMKAEQLVHQGFLIAYRMWKAMAENDPAWAKENPFSFDVFKENGSLLVKNSMEMYMRSHYEKRGVG